MGASNDDDDDDDDGLIMISQVLGRMRIDSTLADCQGKQSNDRTHLAAAAATFVVFVDIERRSLLQAELY